MPKVSTLHFHNFRAASNQDSCHKGLNKSMDHSQHAGPFTANSKHYNEVCYKKRVSSERIMTRLSADLKTLNNATAA
jgi:hypothetical protein